MSNQPQPKKEEKKHSKPQGPHEKALSKAMHQTIPVQQSTDIGFMADHFTDRKVEPVKVSDNT